MKDLLITTLAALGYPVILHGSMAEGEAFPDNFITFLTLDAPEAAAFDNGTALTVWQYQVNFYSNDPAKVASEPPKIRTALKAAGFIPQGKGRDLPSDEPTHTGWTCDYYFLENEMEG